MDKKLRNRILTSIKKPKLRIERALIVTETHQKTIGEPMIIRRAKVFHELANRMPINIEDWQLVVGNFSAEPFAVNPNPELCWKTILDGMENFSTREGDKYSISENDKQTLREVLPWWEGKSIQENILNMLPEKAKDAYDAGVMDTGYLGQGSGNFSANYQKVIKRGLIHITGEIKEKINRLDLSDPVDFEKWLFYKACLICCDGAIDYAHRYANLAKEMADKESCPDRRKELLQIAENCERVPEYPVRNLYEAVQSFWFLHILVHFEASGGAGIVAGRLDQLLYPYSKEHNQKDIKKWLENLWINYNQILYFLPGRSAAVWSGHPMSEQPTIGGITETGEDASNDLTKYMLEIEKEVRLPQPDIAIMYHEKIDKSILEKSCETLPLTMKPKIFNYSITKNMAINKGATEGDLVNLVTIGCVASGPEGKNWGNNGMAFINIAKVMELTLNNGIDPATKKKIGVTTGNPGEFTSFNEVNDAFKRQLREAIKNTVTMVNVIQKVHGELNPQSFTSILIDDCIDKGKSVWQGGARYDITGVEGVGLANVADSLAAIKKLIFEEQQISITELLTALKDNYQENYEDIRRTLIRKAPKYGNDEDYVDEIAVELADFYCREFMKKKTNRGNFCPSLASVSAHVGLGKYVGALPDGRKAGCPLADGMSPAQGVCSNGPTATLRSVAKINHSLITGGSLLNMKFDTAIFNNPAIRSKFIHLVETFMLLGGYHIQFNIINPAILREAQEHPEKHPHLLVRVAAYVAQFTQLPKDLQDDIIARSELGLS